jgi:maleate isomerase
VGGEEEIRAAMAEAGCPHPVTSSGAAVQALRAAGARRVSVATPYSKSLTHSLVTFVEEAGFEVASAHYLGLHRGIAGVSQRTIRDLVREADAMGADAVFVSCTSLRTYGTVSTLEAELGVPVFTSNQVSLWAALVAAGVLPRRDDAPDPDWVMGGGNPAARSTLILMEAARSIASAA